MNEPAHILIVDDDQMIRQAFHDMLVYGGYRVTLAATGEEALAYLNLITPDLILLDLGLPGVDGHEVVRQVKADTSKPFIPIIMISAHADAETSVMSLDTGADDFIVKPVSINELLARVRAMMRLQRAQRSLINEQRKTELLLHLTQELGTSIQLDVLLTRFLDLLADSVGAIRASIILTDYGDQTLFFSSSRHPASQRLGDILRQGVAGWVMRERRPLVISDTRSDDRWVPMLGMRQNVQSVAAMPLMREDRVLGVITLVHHTPGFFNETHADLLVSVAAQTVVALESARLFDLTQQQKDLLEQRASELRRINDINSHLSELMYPEQLLLLAAFMVHAQFTYPMVCVWLREKSWLILKGMAGALDQNEQPLPDVRVPIDHAVYGQVAGPCQALLLANVQEAPDYKPLLPGDEQLRSLLILPILLRGEVLGVLEVRSAQPGAFGLADEAILSAIVSQLSVALGNAQLLENEQRRVRQLNQVNRLSVAITAELDALRNLQLAADTIALIFNVEQAGLIMFGTEDDANRALVALREPVRSHDEDLMTLLMQRPDLYELAQTLREPVVVDDLQAQAGLEPLYPMLQERAINALMLVPLMAAEQTLGVIFIDASGRANQYGRAEFELATTVASLIMHVIENIRLYRMAEDDRRTLNAVLGSAADPIILVGPDNELILANPAAEELLQLRINEVRGRRLQDIQLLNRPGAALQNLLPLFNNPSGQSAEHSGHRKELELPGGVSYSVSIAPVRNTENQTLGRVAVLQNITAIKELERRERERVREVFRRYVSPVVAERLLIEGQELGQPTERDVAVIFADMRGFTALTERIGAPVLIEQVLNRYFTAMTKVLYSYEGTVDKFLGDGIIGVFGTPITRRDDPMRALVAAVDMQQAFARLSADWSRQLGLEIGMGVGISYGRAVVGNIGSEERLDYTLIGDVVNTASRLSGIARAEQIIISYHVYDALPQDWTWMKQVRPLGDVPLKGKQEPHRIYEVCY